MFRTFLRELAPLTMEEVRANYTHPRCAYVESIATRGIGTVETIEALVRLIAESR